MGRSFLTTPIYYVNDEPHLGHTYTTVTVDALARWRRLCGDEVRFLTGTDEHGLNVARAAAAHGTTPEDWAATTSARYRAAWETMGIAYDDFIRTTEPRHVRAVQHFLEAVRDRGHLRLGVYEGPYCVSCEAYYTDTEAPDGSCPIHGRPLERMAEENYFFRLSEFTEPLLRWYEEHPQAVVPASRRNEALGLIRGGLQDISVTRTSISWGVPVPWDPRHVVYVWFDALVNYLTSIGYGEDPGRVATWWPVATHVIAKDILRFHCVWWPAMCMAAGLEPPQQVLVHGWLLVGGEKMSKTRLNRILPGDLVARYGRDPVRYYLLRETPIGADGDFSAEGLVARCNADLANNLGNLLSRVAAVLERRFEGHSPPLPDTAESRLAPAVERAVRAAIAAWDARAPHAALEETFGLVHLANAELEAVEPWRATTASDAAGGVLAEACEVLRVVALLAWPAMPASMETLWARLGLAGSPADGRLPDALVWGAAGSAGGAAVRRGEPLFPRLEEESA